MWYVKAMLYWSPTKNAVGSDHAMLKWLLQAVEFAQALELLLTKGMDCNDVQATCGFREGCFFGCKL